MSKIKGQDLSKSKVKLPFKIITYINALRNLDISDVYEFARDVQRKKSKLMQLGYCKHPTKSYLDLDSGAVVVYVGVEPTKEEMATRLFETFANGGFDPTVSPAAIITLAGMDG